MQEYINEDINNGLPQWQKDLINKRLQLIKNDPEAIEDIDGLFEELDKELP